MGLVPLQLVLTALLGAQPSTVEVRPQAGLASTYDQATCATIQGGDAADWDDAAIGEDAPAPVATAEECPVVAPRVADCNDPAATLWFGEMIGTCDMPRGAGIPHAGIRAARNDGRRLPRLLVEVATSGDSAQPLAPAPEERAPTPALFPSTPSLVPPSSFVRLAAPTSPQWRSITGEPLLRPPRA